MKEICKDEDMSMGELVEFINLLKFLNNELLKGIHVSPHMQILLKKVLQYSKTI